MLKFNLIFNVINIDIGKSVIDFNTFARFLNLF